MITFYFKSRFFFKKKSLQSLTCRHQNKCVLPLQRGIDGFQLIESELMKTKAFVEDLHHLLGVGEVETSEAIMRWVSERGLWNVGKEYLLKYERRAVSHSNTFSRMFTRRAAYWGLGCRLRCCWFLLPLRLGRSSLSYCSVHGAGVLWGRGRRRRLFVVIRKVVVVEVIYVKIVTIEIIMFDVFRGRRSRYIFERTLLPLWWKEQIWTIQVCARVGQF